jgi:hypothetical protein
MPKRTNDFQQLVAMIQRSFAPQGAKVTESALIDVPGISDGRVIDVLIESALGPYAMKIAVEAKDEGRMMDSTKFESILGKYCVEGGVKVNKIVIIAHRGFYQPVIDRAKKLDIDLYTLEQAYEVDWDNKYPRQLHLQTPPHLCGFEIHPPLRGQDLQLVLKEGNVTCHHGHNHGSLSHFVLNQGIGNALKQKPSLFADLHRKAISQANGEAKITIECAPDHPVQLRYRSEVYAIDSFKFQVHAISAVGQMTYSMCRLTSTEGKEVEMPFGETLIAGKRIRMLMPEGMKSPRIILRIDSV